MEAVPSSLFAMPLTLSADDVSVKIPRRFVEEFDVKAANLSEGRNFLAAIAPGRPTLRSSISLTKALSSVDPRPVVICSPHLDRNLMKSLAAKGIAYIRDEGNVFLPFLGMAASPVPEGKAPKALSPRAQRIVLNLIAERWDGLTAGDLAKASGVSNATVTKCLAEIEAILPPALSTEGKSRILRNPGMTKGDLLETFEPYLTSPVKRRTSLKGHGALETLKQHGALLSGESALPYYSDLAHDTAVIRVAVYRKRLPSIMQEAGGTWVEAKWFERPDVVVEEWTYEVDGTNDVSIEATGFAAIDALGLYAEMKDEGKQDVRLEDAVAQLREVACQQ